MCRNAVRFCPGASPATARSISGCSRSPSSALASSPSYPSLPNNVMRLILLSDVKALGKKGQVVDVAEGYARNFLLPRKLATEASKGALTVLGEQKAAH